MMRRRRFRFGCSAAALWLLCAFAVQAQDGGQPILDADAGPEDGRLLEEAPVDTAPVDTAPVDTAPVDTAPDDAAPDDAAPDDTAPDDAALNGVEGDAGTARSREDAVEPEAARNESRDSPVWGEATPAPAPEEPPTPAADDAAVDVDAAKGATVLAPFPARHSGEVLRPALPPERWWATRTTLSAFAADLMGYGTLWAPGSVEEGDVFRDPDYGLHGHLLAYARLPSGVSALAIDAALVLRVLDRSTALSPAVVPLLPVDDGSYLKATWTPFGARDVGDPKLTLTVFPASSSRLRLGSLDELSWGGSGLFLSPERITPAARAGIEWHDAYAFVAGKMAMMIDETPGVSDLRPFGGTFAGVGVDLFDLVALQTAGSWVTRGTSPTPGTAGELLSAFGVSTRAALHFGRSEVIAPDHRSLRRDPALLELTRLGEQTLDVSDVNGLIAVEHAWLGGSVPSADDLRSMAFVPTQALALSGRLELFAFSFALDAMVREAPWGSFDNLFVLRSFTGDAVHEPELSLGGNVAVVVPSLSMTFALFGSVGLPATVTTHVQPDPTERTIVLVADHSSILPAGEGRAPNGTLGLAGQVDLGPALSLLVSLWTTADGNATRLVDSATGLVQRERLTTFGQPLLLDGAGSVTLQLRL